MRRCLRRGCIHELGHPGPHAVQQRIGEDLGVSCVCGPGWVQRIGQACPNCGRELVQLDPPRWSSPDEPVPRSSRRRRERRS